MAKAEPVKKPEPVEQEPVDVVDEVVATVKVTTAPPAAPEPAPEPPVVARDASGDRVPQVQLPRSRRKK